MGVKGGRGKKKTRKLQVVLLFFFYRLSLYYYNPSTATRLHCRICTRPDVRINIIKKAPLVTKANEKAAASNKSTAHLHLSSPPATTSTAATTLPRPRNCWWELHVQSARRTSEKKKSRLPAEANIDRLHIPAQLIDVVVDIYGLHRFQNAKGGRGCLWPSVGCLCLEVFLETRGEVPFL